MRRLLLALASTLPASLSLGAQSPSAGVVVGVVTDSVHGRPLAGATVMLSRTLPAEPPVMRVADSDERGRFRFDSLPAGRYALSVGHPMLDTLGLTLPTIDVAVRDSGETRLDYFVPTGAALRAAACPGVRLARGAGALIGRLRDAGSELPLAGALVAVSWADLTVDPTTLRAGTAPRSVALETDSTGLFRVCGVSTEVFVFVQVQRQGRAGSVVRTSIPDDLGVRQLELSFSAAGARELARDDSAAAPDTTRPTPLRGRAVLAGTVRRTTGEPLPGVQVRVVDAAGVARTDSLGRFTLTELPPGTQIMEARALGFMLAQQPVELRDGRTTEAALRLLSIVSLDSVRVVARRSRYPEFERRRQRGGFGRFLTEEDLAKRHAFETSDLLRMTPGFRVAGFGLDAKVVSSRGRTSMWRPCEGAHVVIDGMRNQDINLVQPQDIAAMEIYASSAGAPPEYDSACGLIVIWTKR